MSNKVYVSGLGAISAIGKNIAESLYSLQNSKSGIGKMQYLDSIYKDQLPVAEVKLNNEELSIISGILSKKSRTAMLSLIAAKEAIDNSGIENISKYRTGFISANSAGGMDKSEGFFAEWFKNPNKGKLRDLIHHECGSITELVANELGITDYVSTISTACSSSANAIFHAARLIKNNVLDIAIAGGVDALTKFTLNGFNTLMILDHMLCQPFDENRRGLNLGEGAGYIVLIAESVAEKIKKAPMAVLSGYCNANDAFHQTASSPDGNGSYLAMSGALKMSNLNPSDIDYINLHGTGTMNNDIAEGTAIKRLFSPAYPKMSSTKSYTGHTLGACGGIEAVFSVLSIQHGIIYPNLHLQEPIKDLPFCVETSFIKEQAINHVLSNSFGFGGNCSSLIFSKT